MVREEKEEIEGGKIHGQEKRKEWDRKRERVIVCVFVCVRERERDKETRDRNACQKKKQTRDNITN